MGVVLIVSLLSSTVDVQLQHIYNPLPIHEVRPGNSLIDWRPTSELPGVRVHIASQALIGWIM